jgi:predicted negative regulator of RcsB-dependent stress response
VALLIVAGGFAYYYNQLAQRSQLEDSARAALLKAKTPEEMVKVADQYPNTDQGTLALLSAADGSFAKEDYSAAIQDYQRIIQAATPDQELRESAQLGLASSLEASGKTDDAIKTYLDVATQGDKSPFAPAAYFAVARLYEERGDKTSERTTLTSLAGLDPDSVFVKQAQMKLKELTPPAQPALSVPVTGSNPMPAPAAPTQ